MKKLLVLIFATAFIFASSSITNSAHAQNAGGIQEGDIVINGGVGFGTTFTTFGAGFGLPFGAGVEYGITDLETGSIGLGGDFGISSGSGVTMTTFGARGSYYFNDLFDVENPDLDIYSGLGLYYRNFSVSGMSGNWGTGVYAAFHAGVRYYFADNIGGFAEVGNNWGWLNLGVAIKL